MISDDPPPAPLYDRERLLAFLAENGIVHTTHEHSAVFRVDEALELMVTLPGAHTKSLFLKNKKGRMWLVAAAHDTVIDLKRLSQAVGSDRLSFGSESLLWEMLGVRPGSVTALGLVNDRERQVTFIVDRRLWEADVVNFHPLVNTATTALARDQFRRFIHVLQRAPIVMDFDTMARVS